MPPKRTFSGVVSLQYNCTGRSHGLSVPSVERKLAAIFAAYVAVYGRLVGQDEVGTLARLKACREIAGRLIAEHPGRIFKTGGDSVLVDFASAAQGRELRPRRAQILDEREEQSAGSKPMRSRTGVHVGDLVVDETDLLRDGIKIAARLEALSEAGRA